MKGNANHRQLWQREQAAIGAPFDAPDIQIMLDRAHGVKLSECGASWLTHDIRLHIWRKREQARRTRHREFSTARIHYNGGRNHGPRRVIVYRFHPLLPYLTDGKLAAPAP